MSEAAERLRAFLDRVPYVGFLGLRAELEGEEMTAILPFKPPLVGNANIQALHGGVIGAFLEATALAQLYVAHPGRLAKTVDITIEYLRPGLAQTAFARAELLKVGRRVANVHVRAWQDTPAKPFATLGGHFLLRDAS